MFNFKKNKFILTLIILFGFSNISFAAPALYAPGETLDPACVPTDPLCTVRVAESGTNTTINELTGLTTPLTNLQGGTGFNTYTKGDILSGDAASALTTLPVGTNGQVLTADSAASTGLNWTSVTGGVTADSLDFTEFSDSLTLDASTVIESIGSFFLKILNTGTGPSLLVEDESSDTTPFVIDDDGNVGVGLDNPGQKLHIFDGDMLFEKNGENAIQFKNNSLVNNPVYHIGRIQIAGIGIPEWRIMYSDDVETTPYKVFGVESSGTAASVIPPSISRGSHFEGFQEGDVQPYFRMNSYPSMTVELGNGGNDLTDVHMRRTADSELTYFLGANALEERMKLANDDFSVSFDGTQKINLDKDDLVFNTTGVEKARLNKDGFLTLTDGVSADRLETNTLTANDNIQTRGSFNAVQNVVNINSDDFSLDVSNKTFIRIYTSCTSGGGNSSSDCTFIPTLGVNGQIMVIEWIDNTLGELLDDTAIPTAGYVRLSSDWTPDAKDTLTLIATDSDWVEISRSSN